jgi:hypothetical protein
MTRLSRCGPTRCDKPALDRQSQTPRQGGSIRWLISLVMAVLLVVWVCGSGLAAEGGYTPKPGSPERKQISGELRKVVESELKKPVRFRIDALKVRNGWAFLRGVLLNKSGKPMDYRGTPYQESIEAGTFDDRLRARCCTRKETDGKWWRMPSAPPTCLSLTGRSVTTHRRAFSNSA